MSWELIIGLAGVAISLISIFIAGWSAYNSTKYSKKQTDLQRRVVELEEQREREKQSVKIKADVKAEVMYRNTAAGKQPYKFRVFNDGAGAAERIRVMINGDPIKECGFILTEQNTLEVIAAGTDVKFPMATSKDSPSNWKTVVLWDDKTGTNNKFETILTK